MHHFCSICPGQGTGQLSFAFHYIQTKIALSAPVLMTNVLHGTDRNRIQDSLPSGEVAPQK